LANRPNWHSGGDCSIPISQDDLAQASAASRKTVVRVLADLRRNKAIHTARGAIPVLVRNLSASANEVHHICSI
jgi:CRP-like cAMP-binding protein